VTLTVIAGEDPLDPATADSASKAQPGPYTRYLKPGALKGKRFAVPAFILDGETPAFQGVCPNATPEQFAKAMNDARTPLKPETRAAFMKSVEEIRAAGATVLIDDQISPPASLLPPPTSARSLTFARALKHFSPALARQNIIQRTSTSN